MYGDTTSARLQKLKDDFDARAIREMASPLKKICPDVEHEVVGDDVGGVKGRPDSARNQYLDAYGHDTPSARA
ncbi:uncharacterized protein SCHCODRAFT_02668454 [Schizophyllum commune H4-8]|nr:uncharacterized protein SCHCODRAFT_02668454 [Schizophyllum commune H4-8]KAI5891026.1 hypothetical protein SCHCODRAFT_02668454 [Schizophyllum commune H4-8]